MWFDQLLNLLKTLLVWPLLLGIVLWVYRIELRALLVQFTAFVARIKLLKVPGATIDASEQQDSPTANKLGEALPPAAPAPTTTTPAQIATYLAAPRSPLQLEVDAAARDNAVGKALTPEVREELLIRALTDNRIGLAFERFYRSIFGSQIYILTIANRPGGLPREELEKQFDAAKALYPEAHANRTFDAWLGWIMETALIRVDDGVYRTTIRGTEFLKYMVDQQLQPKLG